MSLQVPGVGRVEEPRFNEANFRISRWARGKQQAAATRSRLKCETPSVISAGGIGPRIGIDVRAQMLRKARRFENLFFQRNAR